MLLASRSSFQRHQYPNVYNLYLSTSRYSSWIDRTQLWSTASLQLLRTLWSATDRRGALLSQAKSNIVAQQYLSWEQTWKQLRYYGVMEYWRRRNLPPASDNAWKSPQQTRGQARVAFMVTATMKRTLEESLGFSKMEIRRMKPLEAQLALQHQVTPAQWETKIPELVAAHWEEQQKDQETDNKMSGTESSGEACTKTKENEGDGPASQELAASGVSTTLSTNNTLKTTLPIGDQAILSLPSSASTVTMDQGDSDRTKTTSTPISNNDSQPSTFASYNTSRSSSSSLAYDSVEEHNQGRIWYQVVEHPSDRVVALFATKEEAEQALAIYDKQAKRKNGPRTITYAVRQKPPFSSSG